MGGRCIAGGGCGAVSCPARWLWRLPVGPSAGFGGRTGSERAGVLHRTDLRLQDAREGLESLNEPFDLAFIDGVKAQYGDYFEALVPLLGPRAVLAVDNVLMSGTVATGRGDGNWTDAQIESARAFNERLLNDKRFSGAVFPV